MARKHISQFDQTERAFVHGYIRTHADRITGKHHFYDRASERAFTLDDAREAIRNGLVIEAHNDKAPDVRVLVRNQTGTCAVLSLNTLEVITVYYNAPEDTHAGMNWTPYTWRTDLTQVVKSLRR